MLIVTSASPYWKNMAPFLGTPDYSTNTIPDARWPDFAAGKIVWGPLPGGPSGTMAYIYRTYYESSPVFPWAAILGAKA